MIPRPSRRNIFGLFLPETRFIAGLFCLLVGLFAILRLVLLWRNSAQSVMSPDALLVQSFWVGLRFDLAIAAYILLPLYLLLLIVRRGRKLLLGAFVGLVGVLILLGLAEAEFYRELEMRLNSLVFEYLSHPDIVGGMIWEGYPVFRYLLLWTVLVLLSAAVVAWLHRRLLQPSSESASRGSLLARTLGVAVALTLMVFASRGGFAHEPLRWGDAFFSHDPFANHLALNGIFTLGRSILDKFGEDHKYWIKALPPETARAKARAMLLLADDTDLSGNGDYPLLRQRRQVDPAPLAGQPLNVVVIMMESFSARHTGALGANPSLTPEFDALSQQGILFARAFSNGTHTHQGVFATLASFPNIPGYEYLMKTLEAKQEFSGLPSLLSRQGYQTVFLYNGLFSWDNKEGFFRQHGIRRFIGNGDYADPVFVDPVWGVSDFDVFMRANEEFRDMAEDGPFFGAILTLSNHSPFNLPDPLPFERIRAENGLEGRYNAMRYADWTLGEFFRRAGQEEYFKNTLFVVTGDHGFGTPPAITDMQLEVFHVPLWFYAPGRMAHLGERRQTVASQVDIGPTVLGLLDLDLPHQAWGRDLLSPALADEGFAIVKASGGKPTVALIEGDYLLTQAPEEKPQLFRVSLGFPPAASENLYTVDKKRAEEMRERLRAYVEAALLGLRERKLGVPEGKLPAPAAASLQPRETRAP